MLSPDILPQFAKNNLVPCGKDQENSCKPKIDCCRAVVIFMAMSAFLIATSCEGYDAASVPNPATATYAATFPTENDITIQHVENAAATVGAVVTATVTAEPTLAQADPMPASPLVTATPLPSTSGMSPSQPSESRPVLPPTNQLPTATPAPVVGELMADNLNLQTEGKTSRPNIEMTASPPQSEQRFTMPSETALAQIAKLVREPIALPSEAELQELARSTAFLVFQYENDIDLGTAVHLGSGYFLTAGHEFYHPAGRERDYVSIFIRDSSGTEHRAQSEFHQLYPDIALVYCGQLSGEYQPVYLGDPRTVSVGDLLVVVPFRENILPGGQRFYPITWFPAVAAKIYDQIILYADGFGGKDFQAQEVSSGAGVFTRQMAADGQLRWRLVAVTFSEFSREADPALYDSYLRPRGIDPNLTPHLSFATRIDTVNVNYYRK